MTETKWLAKSKIFITWPSQRRPAMPEPGHTHSQHSTGVHAPARHSSADGPQPTARCSHSSAEAAALHLPLLWPPDGNQANVCHAGTEEGLLMPNHLITIPVLHFLEGKKHSALSEVTWSVEFKYFELSKIICYSAPLHTTHALILS